MTIKVIDKKNLPTNFPLSLYLVILLIMDRFNASDIYFILVLIVFILHFSFVMLRKVQEKSIQVFNDPAEVQILNEAKQFLETVRKENEDLDNDIKKRSNELQTVS